MFYLRTWHLHSNSPPKIFSRRPHKGPRNGGTSRKRKTLSGRRAQELRQLTCSNVVQSTTSLNVTSALAWGWVSLFYWWNGVKLSYAIYSQARWSFFRRRKKKRCPLWQSLYLHLTRALCPTFHNPHILPPRLQPIGDPYWPTNTRTRLHLRVRLLSWQSPLLLWHRHQVSLVNFPCQTCHRLVRCWRHNIPVHLRGLVIWLLRHSRLLHPRKILPIA